MTRAARPLLWPLVPVYRLGLALREVQLRTGLKPVRRLRRPVVSVGSLSAGGAGKTPLVIALAKALVARGIAVDLLSRGYGRRSALPLLVDSRGTADKFGDEPLVIAREAQVPVYVAAERYEAGLLAEASQQVSEPASERVGELASWQVGEPASQRVGVHLLDDGFQHRQLHRDVDILLLSRGDLADHLLPAGNLRETLRAAERADIFAVPEEEPEVAEWVTSRGWRGMVWRVRRRMDVPRIEVPVVAFCGIARPEQFFQGLESGGVRVAARFAFRDHHRYTAGDLERIAVAAQKAGAKTILTTEKDRVRLGAMTEELPASISLKTIPLRVEIENEGDAIDWLIGRIRGAE
jgi:tetraacyldisaccharide 4'-kinase